MSPLLLLFACAVVVAQPSVDARIQSACLLTRDAATNDTCLEADGCSLGSGGAVAVRLSMENGNDGDDYALGNGSAPPAHWKQSACGSLWLGQRVTYELTFAANGSKIVNDTHAHVCVLSGDCDSMSEGSEGTLEQQCAGRQGIDAGCAGRVSYNGDDGRVLPCHWVDLGDNEAAASFMRSSGARLRVTVHGEAQPDFNVSRVFSRIRACKNQGGGGDEVASSSASAWSVVVIGLVLVVYVASIVVFVCCAINAGEGA